MATSLRESGANFDAIVAAINELKADLTATKRAMNVDLVSVAADAAGFATPTVLDPGSHADRSEKTITAANATDLPTSLALVNQILGVYKFHMADTLAHKVSGVALASYTRANSLATAITRANDIKAKYNTHRASTTHHYTADSTNSTTATDATDQSSLNTLLNELKTDINAHMASGPATKSLRIVGA